jgi:hypothetical protein
MVSRALGQIRSEWNGNNFSGKFGLLATAVSMLFVAVGEYRYFSAPSVAEQFVLAVPSCEPEWIPFFGANLAAIADSKGFELEGKAGFTELAEALCAGNGYAELSVGGQKAHAALATALQEIDLSDSRQVAKLNRSIDDKFAATGLNGTNFGDIAQNINTSIEDVPGALTGVSYTAGILLGIIGVLKIKDHVENPAQTELEHGAIRLTAGGGLFALPIVYDAMTDTVGPGEPSVGSDQLNAVNFGVQ